MKSSSPIAVRVGIFMTLGLILLLGLSISVGNFTFAKKSYRMQAFFRETPGIEVGSRVTLRGVPIGQVNSMEWAPTRLRVRVELLIERDYQVPDNAFATVKSASLLGGTVVNIDFDESVAIASFLSDGSEIETRASISIDDAIAQVATFGEEGTKLFRSFSDGQESTFEKINEILDENRENIRRTTESFADVGPKVGQLADRLNELTASVQEGEGTMGALFKHRELYDNLLKVSEDAKEISGAIREGEGTLSKLVYDDAIATEAENAFAKLGDAATRVDDLVGRNSEDIDNFVKSLGDASPRIDRVIANLDEITTKINSGDGTLGKLVNDGSLFDDIKKAVNQVGESFESSEEQSVVRSFFSLMFGALV
ncbi:MAG: MlaD family protein [Candidatus Sumerlaeia bacterium]|nr:MlaD family protein [Candidatus Sumerlaeia bacterium]